MTIPSITRPLRFLAVIGIGMIIIVFLIAFLVHKATPKYTFNMSSETVVKQIESLNRLETASYTIEKVIDAKTNGNAFQQFLFGDRLLLIAVGKVVAGFDLSKVTTQDSVVDNTNRTLKLTLPAPEILTTTIDNSQTRVYDRRSGLLTKGDPNLESQARTQAESVIRSAACTGGILSEASKNAQTQLITLFKATGFTSVTIITPSATCQ
jgi:hypothetical protein